MQLQNVVEEMAKFVEVNLFRSISRHFFYIDSFFGNYYRHSLSEVLGSRGETINYDYLKKLVIFHDRRECITKIRQNFVLYNVVTKCFH